jgi:hypothetical protein
MWWVGAGEEIADGALEIESIGEFRSSVLVINSVERLQG